MKTIYILQVVNLSTTVKKLPEAILDTSVAVGWIAALKISVFVIVSGVSLSTGVNLAGDEEVFSSVEVAVNVVNKLVSDNINER